MNEIRNWKHYSDEKRDEIMAKLAMEQSTHQCPQCQSPTFCGIQAGEEHCWCFDVENKNLDATEQTPCLCRKCLSAIE